MVLPMAWRERQLPFYGMLKFLWLPRTPKYIYLYLQAFLVKHAIDIRMIKIKNSKGK